VVDPAAFESCIAVAGTRPDDRAWKGSARGSRVAISAPATQVWAADPKKDAARAQGTSFAVAIVAGVAALWLAHHGRARLLQRYGGKVPLQYVFKYLLRRTARSAPIDPATYGPGIVDAVALLQADLPAPGTVVASLGLAAARPAPRDRLRDMLEPLDLPPAALRAWARVLPGGTAAARKPSAEDELLQLELAQIFYDHGNVYRALANGLRAGLAARAGRRKAAALEWPELEGLAKHASERLRRQLSR
jgi:hypothetical protein